MASHSKTIVIVPGAWHSPEHYELLAERLQQAGHPTVSVTLKSVGAEEPLEDFWPDVEAIRAEISKIADAGQEIVVVAHSYRGIPSSQAIEGLDIESRKAAGKSGGVVHLVYLAAFCVPEGGSLSGTFGGQDAPWYDANAERTVVNPVGSEQVFYNDVPEGLVKKCVASLRPHSLRCFDSKLQWAPWKHGVPTTYLYALQDQAIPISIQRMMVEEFAKGYPIATETVDTGHSPFLSKLDETVDAVRRAADEKV